MSAPKGKITQSFYRLRTFSKPEAIAARESESLARARSEDLDSEDSEDSEETDSFVTAEILPPLANPPAALSVRRLAVITALTLAMLYLIVMLVLAFNSPLML